jgi:hypothetical protein
MIQNQISLNQPMPESGGDQSNQLSLGSDPDHFDQPLSDLEGIRSGSQSRVESNGNSVAI